jgi:hypothetical protein
MIGVESFSNRHKFRIEVGKTEKTAKRPLGSKELAYTA